MKKILARLLARTFWGHDYLAEIGKAMVAYSTGGTDLSKKKLPLGRVPKAQVDAFTSEREFALAQAVKCIEDIGEITPELAAELSIHSFQSGFIAGVFAASSALGRVPSPWEEPTEEVGGLTTAR